MKRIDDVFRALLLAYERLDAEWRRRYALTANEQLVVMFLAVEGPMSPTKLSEASGLTTAGMSTLLDRLEEADFVQRERMRDDRRRVLVTLTKKGAKARFDFDRSHEAIAAAAASLPREEQAVVERFLELAISTLHELD
ncbi:MAG: hypothetical protein JWN72_2190 [Thermoleophilia bacterium]|nr:hypothetical protein [Thermoleophilia bacterium]